MRKKKENKEQEEIVDYKVLYEEEHEKYLRAVADYQNLQRRTSEQMSRISRDSFNEAVLKIVHPTYNDLKRGVENNIDGCELILKNLVSNLNSNGIDTISPNIGDVFHDWEDVAIMTQHIDDVNMNMRIFSVFNDGLKDVANNKVIADAKVIVYTND